MNAGLAMVLKAVQRFEPEGAFDGIFMVVCGFRKRGPGIAHILANWLKEYQKCYDIIECQFFNYFREGLLAEKM